MKKKLKLKLLFSVLAISSFYSQGTKAFPQRKWNTCVCSSYNSDGSVTYHSACEEPDSTGPCDRVQAC